MHQLCCVSKVTASCYNSWVVFECIFIMVEEKEIFPTSSLTL